MSLCTCNFFSKALKHYVDVAVYIPSVHNGDAILKSYEEMYPPGKKFKTLYLLHGALEDYSAWIRGSSVEFYAEAAELALVMPSGQNSCYVNAVSGLDYFTFISYELPMWAESIFPLLTDRQDRYIAGLSMGGYGALRTGLAFPERYAAIGDFSGAVDIIATAEIVQQFGYEVLDYNALYGGVENIKGTDNDLFALSKKCKDSGAPLPSVYIECGTEDLLCYEINKQFGAHLKGLGFDVNYNEVPGVHEWPVWDHAVDKFIKSLT